MSPEPAQNDASRGDDLFDLPKDAATPPAAAGSVDAPGSALPRRAQPTTPAGPPISSVESSAAALLQQVRRRQGKDEGATPAQLPVAPAPTRAVRAPWIVIGVLVVVNLATLGYLLASSGSAPATPDPAASVASTPREPAPEPASERAPKPRAPLVSSAGPSALESALEVLDEARTDLAAGRRSSARARLGRLALAIDAIEITRREEIRGEIGLIVARSLQEDAEAARRFAR